MAKSYTGSETKQKGKEEVLHSPEDEQQNGMSLRSFITFSSLVKEIRKNADNIKR